MRDEPLFHCVFAGASPLVDVVFVHGLTGDAHKTWTSDVEGEFWPQWLQGDLAHLSVFTLGYPTSIFEKWVKKEMDMFERASNVLGSGLITATR